MAWKAFLIIALGAFSAPAQAAECGQGSMHLSRADIQQFLTRPGSPLQLCNADLEGVDLSGLNLSGSSLRGAILKDANLAQTDFMGADLRGADLTMARAPGATFENAHLEGAYLNGADFAGANLRNTFLDGAYLSETNLSEVNLSGASLTRTFYGAIGEPRAVLGVTGVATLNWGGSYVGIATLRKLFREAGERQLEREATYSIENWQTLFLINNSSIAAKIEGYFRLVAFDWTVSYGRHSGRALIILIFLILFSSPVYTWLMWRRRTIDRCGIYRISPPGRVEMKAGRPHLIEVAVVELLRLTIWKALAFGAYFSLLSAFHFGFREFSVGNWISRIQPNRFTLEPVGWSRTLSGFQSLLSVYLIAVWALTYFGRPFQ